MSRRTGFSKDKTTAALRGTSERQNSVPRHILNHRRAVVHCLAINRIDRSRLDQHLVGRHDLVTAILVAERVVGRSQAARGQGVGPRCGGSATAASDGQGAAQHRRGVTAKKALVVHAFETGWIGLRDETRIVVGAYDQCGLVDGEVADRVRVAAGGVQVVARPAAQEADAHRGIRAGVGEMGDVVAAVGKGVIRAQHPVGKGLAEDGTGRPFLGRLRLGGSCEGDQQDEDADEGHGPDSFCLRKRGTSPGAPRHPLQRRGKSKGTLPAPPLTPPPRVGRGKRSG